MRSFLLTPNVFIILILTSFWHSDAWSFMSSGNINTSPSLGKKSTALDVLKELNRSNRLAGYVKPGCTAVVTGGNSGIGVVTVSTLALSGMNVVLCARNMESAQETLDKVPDSCRDNVSIQRLDLADMSSIKDACDEIINSHSNISVIVNNAGIMALPKRIETSQGIEMQVGTNHVGHHFFTRLLLPSLQDGGRVVTVASTAHEMSKGNNWDSESDYSAWGTYGKSKLANILFAKSLEDKVKESDRDLSSVSLHPGVIGTNLWRNTPSIFQAATSLFSDKTIDQGAATNVFCALVNKLEGGAYYKDCQVSKVAAQADDVELRENLWAYTEQLIAEKGYEMPSSLFTEEKVLAEETA